MAITKSQIIVSSNPKGQFLEGTIQAALLPGTLVMLQASAGFVTNYIGNEPPLVEANVAVAGAFGWVGVLMEDSNQGVLPGTAYQIGTKCRAYTPIPGEVVNVRAGVGAGTANNFNVGDKLMIAAANGWLIPATGTPQQIAFAAYEALAQITADSLLACIRLG